MRDGLALAVQIQLSNSHEDVSPRSRGAMRPSFASFSVTLQSRGCRESRVRAAPAVPCANGKRKRTRAYRFSGGNPAFPARWVTAYCALSLVTGFLATIIGGILLANLTPASGRQDHTASPSAMAAFVVRRRHVHRIPPRVRDDRDPPLSSGETGRAGSVDLPDRLSGIFFVGGLDRVLGDLLVRQGC